ncbi:MFS transporter [Streptosporangiaceae bacterium NEAU-GS5]|nr:MFS transporter [Streptosporangiaceae bacterium NEAU-GS5]
MIGIEGRARWAITAIFGANGVLIASLVSRTPSLKLDLALSDGQLGVTAALFGAAAVIAMQVAGRLAARAGSRTIVRVVAPLLPFAMIGIGAAPGIAALIVLQLLCGAAQGMLDVTMNAHAVSVERALSRRIMNGCHAAWSIGAVTGSLLGSAAAQAGMARWLHYTLVAAVLLPVMLGAGLRLLPASADRRPAGTPAAPRARTRAGWTRQLLVLGAMGATVLTTEAAIANWSGVLLHDHLSASLGAAALGYLAFSLFQTAGRLVGDRLLERGSPARLLRLGALIAATGLAVVVLSPWAALGVAGFAVMGVGLATPLPVLFGVVGHLGAARDGGSAVMVARFGTMTFTGLLMGPAIIGWFAEMIGLTWTLAALIPLLGAVAAAAGAATRSRPESTAPAPPSQEPARVL